MYNNVKYTKCGGFHMQEQLCPKCKSENVYYSKKRSCYVCEDCEEEFIIEKSRLTYDGKRGNIYSIRYPGATFGCIVCDENNIMNYQLLNYKGV